MSSINRIHWCVERAEIVCNAGSVPAKGSGSMASSALPCWLQLTPPHTARYPPLNPSAACLPAQAHAAHGAARGGFRVLSLNSSNYVIAMSAVMPQLVPRF